VIRSEARGAKASTKHGVAQMMHAVINHLWQSTVFAIMAGLLTLAFRRNRAVVRYWRVLSVRRSLASLRASLLLLVALLAACGNAIAQTSAPLPKFEVASIRPAKSGWRFSGQQSPPGRLRATNVTAKNLIENAYNRQPRFSLGDDQILGGPKWISSDRFDIDAKLSRVEQDEEKKLPRNEWADQLRLMLQSMLADRFKLKVTQETKELPIYVLVVAKQGPKLAKSTVPPPAALGAKPPDSGSRVWMGRGQLIGIGVSVGDLAGLLSHLPEIGGREVVDQTGLQGRYDFTLKWTPEQGQRFGGPGPSGTAGGAQSAAGKPAAPGSSGPSIFTAIQQQLGLRLKPSEGPVEMVVIDHIEHPSAN
jgi:uncharacterized protein (TIGR03435 family)